MEHKSFINGGYVLYGITGDFVGKMSAWFDAEGNLIDAEQTLYPFGPVRPVKRGGPMARLAERVGKRYKHIPTP